MAVASLRGIHEDFAWFVVAGNGLAGLWALAAHFREPFRVRALWWFTLVAELTVFVQVSLGVGMVAGQDIEAPQFHMFYGFLAIIAIGMIYSYPTAIRCRIVDICSTAVAASSSWDSAFGRCCSDDE